MSCRSLYVKLDNVAGAALTDLISMTDDSGEFIFDKVEYTELLAGKTFSINRNSTQFYLSNITQNAFWGTCNPQPSLDTKLLLHFDGAQGATQTTDASTFTNPIQMVSSINSIFITATYGRFGQSLDNSIRRPGLSFPNSVSFVDCGTHSTIADEAFSIDFWMMVPDFNSRGFYVKYSESGFDVPEVPNWLFSYWVYPSGATILFNIRNFGYNTYIVWQAAGLFPVGPAQPFNIKANEWFHVAFCREPSYTPTQQADWRLYVNGIRQNLTIALNLFGLTGGNWNPVFPRQNQINSNYKMRIGSPNNGWLANTEAGAFIDEFRFRVGTASFYGGTAYSGYGLRAFTPPNAPY